MNTKTIDLDELEMQNLTDKITDAIFASFAADVRKRFKEDHAVWAAQVVEDMNFAKDPIQGNKTYNASLWEFLVSKGYGLRLEPLYNEILAIFQKENAAYNLSVHHLGRVQVKNILRKDDYAKLIKSN